MFLNNIKKISVSESFKDLIFTLAGSLAIAISAQFSLTLPFISSVPFTLQPHMVLLLAVLLGARRATLCVALYLFEGACGYPVFTHARAGITHLLGPNGGYLLSYLPASYLVGRAFEMYPRAGIHARVLFLTLGNALILLCGFAWLSPFVGADYAWKFGVFPFLLTDGFKTLSLALLLQRK